MAKPLPVSDPHRTAGNGPPARPGDRRAEVRDSRAEAAPAYAGADDLQEQTRLRDENAQLRSLCLELEQALQEASNRTGGDQPGEQTEESHEFEALLEEKSETIRRLHQHVEELQAALTDAENRAAQAIEQAGAGAGPRGGGGPVPREEELLALSEQLEVERRQLQEDEQTLMDQMRQMEVGMAKERAELARQRNDLTRVQAEVRHELERLEKNGALQSKIDNLKSKLQDVTARRGAARSDGPVPGSTAPAANPPQPPSSGPAKGQGLMGRLFGQGGR